MNDLGLAAAFARAVDGPDDTKATLGELVAKLESRGYGVLLFLFAAPNLTPGPSMPGFSTVFALPLVLIAAQMALGVDSPKLPGFLARLGVARPRARGIVAFLAPALNKVEKLLRPRLPVLVAPAMRRFIGAVAIVEAILLLIPLPFLPLIPSVAMTIMALGLVARDGVAVAIGLAACAAAAAAFATALIWGASALGLA
jgi:hypothetical protein